MQNQIDISAPDMGPEALEARMVRNLAAFERYAPHLHAKLAHMSDLATRLEVGTEGRLDIRFGNGSLYRGNALAHTRAKLEKFIATQERVFISMKNADNLLGTAGVYARWAAGYAKSKGFEPANQRMASNSGFAFVFGVGLGLHLPPVMSLTGCRDLVLIEPNTEHIYHSLFSTEWTDVFETARTRGGGVHFILDRTVDSISGQIREVARRCGVSFLDGAYVHQHYSTGLLNSARRVFHEEFSLHLYGLGFYEDELVMMSNAVSNLGRGKAKAISSALPVRDTPVFICGSGPSLDDDIAFVTENRDKVILVSLGSSLRILRAQGLAPDYHVELENEEANAANIRRVAEEFGVPDSTTLIASTSVRPETTSHFSEIIYYFRDRVSSTMLFRSGADALGACGPSVANAALMTLLYMGFRKLYLFGVDMGTRERDVYHSSQTYIGIGAAKEWGSSNRFEVPGNFGGTAYTEGIMNWSRFTFENVVRLHRDVQCVNCSDGVRIENVVPRLSRMVVLPSSDLDRAAVKQKLFNDLPDYDSELCRSLWKRDVIEAHAGDVLAQIRSILADADLELEGNLDWMRKLYDLVIYEVAGEPPTRTFLFGTTVMMLASFYWADGRLTDPEARQAFRRAAIVELQSAYDRMQARYTRLLDDVDAYFAGELDEVYATQSEAA